MPTTADDEKDLRAPVGVETFHALVGATNVTEHRPRFATIRLSHTFKIWNSDNSNPAAATDPSAYYVARRQWVFIHDA
jgi:hypothetical protein